MARPSLGFPLVVGPERPGRQSVCSSKPPRRTAPTSRSTFTKFPQEDTSKGAYKGCRIVKKAEPGAKGFFITPFRQDATVVVHRANWPGG
jgi:hypothetical protein